MMVVDMPWIDYQKKEDEDKGEKKGNTRTFDFDTDEDIINYFKHKQRNEKP